MSDLISRQAAIEAIWKPIIKPNEMIFDALKQAQQNEIETLPSVELERKTGKWKERSVGDVKNTGIEYVQSANCTSCGKYHTTPYMYYFKTYKFCPYCGAKMEGGVTCNAED